MPTQPKLTLVVALRGEAAALLLRAIPRPSLVIPPDVTVAAGDRVLVACLSDARHMDEIAEKFPFRALWCIVDSVQDSLLHLRLAIDYPRLLLRDVDTLGLEALKRSALHGGSVESVDGRVKINAPLPAGKAKTNKIRSRILAVAKEEHELGSSRRKAKVKWKLGRSPGSIR